MGFMWVIGLCVGCRQIFGFNPLRVPSIVVKDQREPLCRTCAERWNELHPENARDIYPDAYEPLDEHELGGNGSYG